MNCELRDGAEFSPSPSNILDRCIYTFYPSYYREWADRDNMFDFADQLQKENPSSDDLTHWPLLKVMENEMDCANAGFDPYDDTLVTPSDGDLSAVNKAQDPRMTAMRLIWTRAYKSNLPDGFDPSTIRPDQVPIALKEFDRLYRRVISQ
jgi:hypothetical protein